ncbi:Diphosphomevalonate decarboxylase [Erysiphe neolycopersici]|uniref:Diphosphomevalonate decarboxylase n=1 Tax=Erysiphe neolycopersici TaxID=212602 RepID=A0A420HDH3_9PEZI|nr:Diphosphomevalonate decarboxylase [Erysiphe neolycopersici]
MSDEKIYQASVTAPVNIAVVKYWGKRDQNLNLPTNSSISITLSQSDLRAHTTASCSASFDSGDSLLLNSKPEDVTNTRVQACFRELRTLRSINESSDSSQPKISHLPLRIVSENNFPTAAGLASSAAGFAALVFAIANLYKLSSSTTDLSRIARQGSGSACRSLFGGFVEWQMGNLSDGSDSTAVQIAPASHWPTMRALILVISGAKKDVSSTSGMQATNKTSELFKRRVEVIAPANIELMQSAIVNKNFETFAKVTMSDSNNFHATCLDTFPPIFYLNDTSRAAIRIVEDLNRTSNRTVAAYTFDAGPNAVIYYQEEDEKLVAGILKGIIGHVDGWHARGKTISPLTYDGFDERAIELLQNGVNRVIMTGIGNGPIITEESLISNSGEPLRR